MMLRNLKHPAQSVGFLQAVRLGLGERQGLFFPETWPVLDCAALLDMPMVPRSAAILQAIIGEELDRSAIEDLVTDAFTFPAPLTAVGTHSACLELFHGPTLAFKDFGARLMAGALALAQAREDVPRTTIVTATSGDTGAAVAQAFYRRKNVDVLILYPEGKISVLQEKLFTTLGENIRTLAVRGDFDACQALVKQVFDDRPLVERLNINSANSINISRVLAQICYYFEAFAQLTPAQRENAVFAVPSGNFGNLTAGLIAKALGLPIRRFIAATNANDTVPRYWQDGRWRPQATVATLSNAMDVAEPNNWPRIQFLLDSGAIARAAIEAVSVSETETVQALRDLDALGYVSEPHAALAWKALQDSLQPGEFGVFLGTAHPAKFKDTVEAVLGRAIAVPQVLQDAAARPALNGRIGADFSALKTALEQFG